MLLFVQKLVYLATLVACFCSKTGLFGNVGSETFPPSFEIINILYVGKDPNANLIFGNFLSKGFTVIMSHLLFLTVIATLAVRIILP